MLLPVKVDLVSKKKSCKQNLVWLAGSCDSKVIFTLLAKVVTFHVRLTVVDVQDLGFEFVSQRFTL